MKIERCDLTTYTIMQATVSQAIKISIGRHRFVIARFIRPQGNFFSHNHVCLHIGRVGLFKLYLSGFPK